MIALFCLAVLSAPLSVLGEYFTVDTNEAYTWNNAFPQSCECVETNVPYSQCTMFKCTCACDLTAGKCDYNCCCDPDCSTNQVYCLRMIKSCGQLCMYLALILD